MAPITAVEIAALAAGTPADTIESVIRSALDDLPPGTDLDTVEVWCREATDEHDAAAGACGLTRHRELLQLRHPLPLDAASALPVRPFDPGRDIDGWLAVNNAAFAWHPDQGGWDRARLAAALAEDWVDLDGFLVHDGGTGIDGFCWTREHHDTDPAMGEIFVIAAHPDVHGRGLGRELTVAGLDHLHRRGFDTAMLWVEDTNDAGLRLYEGLGFTLHHADRSYRRPRGLS